MKHEFLHLIVCKKSRVEVLETGHEEPSCRVCGKNSHLHFNNGVRVCQNCYGFYLHSIRGYFKRGAMYPPTKHVCISKTNNCEINFKSPKMCGKCRVAKCELVGIKIEEASASPSADDSNEEDDCSESLLVVEDGRLRTTSPVVIEKIFSALKFWSVKNNIEMSAVDAQTFRIRFPIRLIESVRGQANIMKTILNRATSYLLKQEILSRQAMDAPTLTDSIQNRINDFFAQFDADPKCEERNFCYVILDEHCENVKNFDEFFDSIFYIGMSTRTPDRRNKEHCNETSAFVDEFIASQVFRFNRYKRTRIMEIWQDNKHPYFFSFRKKLSKAQASSIEGLLIRMVGKHNISNINHGHVDSRIAELNLQTQFDYSVAFLFDMYTKFNIGDCTKMLRKERVTITEIGEKGKVNSCEVCSTLGYGCIYGVVLCNNCRSAFYRITKGKGAIELIFIFVDILRLILFFIVDQSDGQRYLNPSKVLKPCKKAKKCEANGGSGSLCTSCKADRFQALGMVKANPPEPGPLINNANKTPDLVRA